MLLLKTVLAAPGSIYVCVHTRGLVARLSPRGALSLLFAGSSTGSPPLHRMGFERNKDSFLRILSFQGRPTHDNSLSKNNLCSSCASDAASVLRPGSCCLQLEKSTLPSHSVPLSLSPFFLGVGSGEVGVRSPQPLASGSVLRLCWGPGSGLPWTVSHSPFLSVKV